jgi:ring-1,2-phenylacetyl-CoA epoxidase subunit PaaC
LSGFAEKSLKEVKYHLVHARDWVLRMGDGTEESHERIQKAIQTQWEYMPELFEMDEVEHAMLQQGIGVDLSILKPIWHERIGTVLHEATLEVPADGWGHSGGKRGKHSEHLGFILAEMQFLQRAYPGAKW